MDRIAYCEARGVEEEPINHALFEWTWAHLFWEDMKEAYGVKIPMLHPESWAMDMVDTNLIKEEGAARIMCRCWSIWSERNSQCLGEGGRSLTDSVRFVMQTTLDIAHNGK
jgi:hypothetical protein